MKVEIIEVTEMRVGDVIPSLSPTEGIQGFCEVVQIRKIGSETSKSQSLEITTWNKEFSSQNVIMVPLKRNDVQGFDASFIVLR